MTSISSSFGLVKHKLEGASAPGSAGPAFGKHLQRFLETAEPPPPEGATRATVGHVHAGGLNDLAKHLHTLASTKG